VGLELPHTSVDNNVVTEKGGDNMVEDVEILSQIPPDGRPVSVKSKSHVSVVNCGSRALSNLLVA
jgi:hypothetical protein